MIPTEVDIPADLMKEQSLSDAGTTAYTFFMRASLESPASITAQAARIVILSRETQQNLESLKLSLLRDKRRMEAIRTAALNYHHNSKNAPKSLTIYKVIEIINLDFDTAQDLNATLSDKDLEDICLRVYPYYARQKEKFSEDWIRDATDDMIHGRNSRRPWKDSNPQP